jgi:hypothetical protein
VKLGPRRWGGQERRRVEAGHGAAARGSAGARPLVAAWRNGGEEQKAEEREAGV